jgi:surface antigen
LKLTRTRFSLFRPTTLKSAQAILCLSLLAGCTTLGASGKDNPKLALGKGILSGPLGQGLDDGSKRKAIAAELKALSDNTPGKPVEWIGTKGREGTVVAGPAFEISTSVCKRYTHEVRISGNSRKADGTACTGADGVWQPLE